MSQTVTIHEADRAQARDDRKLVQAIERSVVLLRKAIALYEVAETLGTLDDPTREALRKLRAGARSNVHRAHEELLR